jgi:uncharacterized tellurite resistance protein B-like protein
MPTFRELADRVLANGRVEGHDLEVLRHALYADGKINRKEADFLVELYKRAQYHTHAFEQFYYRAIKDHVLANGRVSAGEAAWLREVLFADGTIADEERRFLRQLKGEAKEMSPEFEALFREAMKEPQERHTSGK